MLAARYFLASTEHISPLAGDFNGEHKEEMVGDKP